MSMIGLTLLFLGAASVDAITETIEFGMDENEQFMFHPTAFYSLLGSGPEAVICLDLKTNSSVSVSLGNCLGGSEVGTFGTGTVAFNKSLVDLAMDQARNAATTCKRKPIGIHLRAQERFAHGTIRLFQCVQTHTRTKPPKIRATLIEVTELRPTVTTWNDVHRDVPFNTAGEIWTKKIGLGRAINSAILNKDDTVCLSLHGASFAKVILSKCKGSNDFEFLLPSDTIVALNEKDRHGLRKLKERSCEEKTGSDEWYVKIDTMEQETITGHVSIYACTEESVIDRTGHLYSLYTKNTRYMGTEKTFFFSQGPISEDTFPADIQQIIDSASNGGSGKLQLEIETSSPVTITLSRCRSSARRVILAENQPTGAIIFDQLDTILNMTLLPKCGESESDEALYIHVRSGNNGALGRIRFSLKFSEKFEAEEQRLLRTTVFFKADKKSIIARDYTIGKILDQTLANDIPLGISINTTGNITLTISKCAESKRAMLLKNVGSGVHRVEWSSVIAAVNLMAASTCFHSSPEDFHNARLWIETHDEVAIGSLQFTSLQVNGTKSKLTPFVQLNRDFRASNKTQLITINSDHPQEIDLRYFVEAALADPNLQLHIEAVHASENVPVVFSRCRTESTKGYPMRLSHGHLLEEDLIALRVLMRHPRCDNTALNGFFIHVQDPKYHGKINIFLADFRMEMAKDTVLSLREDDEKVIAIPFTKSQRALAIHVFNNEQYPLKISLSVCQDRTTSWKLARGPLTVGNFKLAPAEIELRRKMAGCPEDTYVYLSLKSTLASGHVTVANAFCNHCKSEISVNFFENYSETSIPDW